MAIPARAASSTVVLGPRLAPIVVPVYYQCIARRLPAYTIATIDDIYGQIVAYERLLLPFSDGDDVTHIIGSLKTISEDGGFEINNLMRGSEKLPVPKLRTIIDRDLFHRAPGRIPSGDVAGIRLAPHEIQKRRSLRGHNIMQRDLLNAWLHAAGSTSPCLP